MRTAADTHATTAPSGDLEARVAALEAALEESRAREAALQASIDRLIEQVRLQATRFWARKSEAGAPNQLLLPIFNECEALADGRDPLAAPKAPSRAAARKGRRGGSPDLSGLPVAETVTYELAEDDRACPECGGALRRIREEVTRTVRVVPAHMEVVERRRAVYACPACSAASAAGEAPAVLLRAPMPADPIPGSPASPSAIAWVLEQKYVMGSPLYRLESRAAADLGPGLSRQTMSNWCVRAAELWLRPLADRALALLRGRDGVMMDETSVACLREPGRSSPGSGQHVWVAGSLEHDPLPPICVYRYGPGRGGDVARSILGPGWEGYLVSDGYAPYFSIPGATNVACLTHIRRKYAELVKSLGGDARARACGSLALEARERIDLVFRAERLAREGFADPEARRAERMRTVAPLLDSLEGWCSAQAPSAMPGGALRRAFDYALGYLPYTRNYLLDGRLPVSNDLSERRVKPFVINRKNFLFFNTPRGADASCAATTLVQTALENGVRPRAYLEWVLTEAPNLGRLDDAALDSLMPWAPGLPAAARCAGGEAEGLLGDMREPVADARGTRA